MDTITKEFQNVRDVKWFKDLSSVYSRLEEIVREEYDTSLEQFLIDYYELKTKMSK
jgi:hypothetical protein